MLIKKITGLVFAAVMAAAVCAPAFAEEKEPIKFEYDKNMVVSEADRFGYTFSFDKDDWEDYVKLTPDASKAGIKIAANTKRAYQGATLKVSADNKADISEQQNFCWELAGADADSDTEGLITMGFEINAKDVGITTFDGSTVIFQYRFDENGVNALLGNSIMAFAADDNYKDTGGYSKAEKNETLSNNITQYRDVVLSIPKGGNSTKIIVEIPVQKAYSGEVLSLDNLDIALPDNVGYIKNLDGYNQNATPKETVEELEIKEKTGNDTGITPTEKDDTADKGTNVLVVVIVVIVGLAVAAGLVFLFIKLKTKFY